MTVVPRMVIAAAGAGCAKTAVTVGLLAAFARRGLKVSGHKVGPDYVDPAWHALAAGRPGRNLDPELVGHAAVAPLFAHGSAGAELAVVEGVAGLYDGTRPEGATAQVATLLRAPVVLVVNAAGMGRSVAALVHGLRSYDPSVWLGGVIVTGTGSAQHAASVTAALEEIAVPVLGVVGGEAPLAHGPGGSRRADGIVGLGRHEPDVVATVDRYADAVTEGVHLDRVLALARSAPGLVAEPWSPGEAVEAGTPGPVVAVLASKDVPFGYQENVELLTAAGVEARFVDPLRDEALPADARALVVGGGLPEAQAARVSENEALRADVARFATDGGLVVAEGGGAWWLAERFDDHPMCGVLPARARTTDRPFGGYRRAVALGGGLLPEGTRVDGHVLRHFELDPRAGTGEFSPLWKWRGRPEEGFATVRTHASFLQTHWAGFPALPQALLGALRAANSPTAA